MGSKAARTERTAMTLAPRPCRAAEQRAGAGYAVAPSIVRRTHRCYTAPSFSKRTSSRLNQALQHVLSGLRPTGRVHLGNYFGAIKNLVELQDRYPSYCFIADWHALTSDCRKSTHF